MTHLSQKSGATSRTLTMLRRMIYLVLVGLIAPLAAFAAASLLFPTHAYAGTITIVDGPVTDPAGGVYTDGYIQSYLAITGSLTITTTGVVTGPDEIRVAQNAVITWTTGNSLTLDAGTNVVISGTILHNGPATGAGGLLLRTSGNPTGTVFIGPGTQTAPVAAGSRFGLTRVDAGNLVLNGGVGVNTFALLGYRTLNRGAAFTVTGVISVTVRQNITGTGGSDAFGFVQIGHGGGDPSLDANSSGTFSGTIGVKAGGNVLFQSGRAIASYAQIGNGGYAAVGIYGGAHTLDADGNVTFLGGRIFGSYAQFGNGGRATVGNHSGGHHLRAGGNVLFQGGTGQNNYAQLGNGGFGAVGSHSGDHFLDADGAVTFQAGPNVGSYVQLGNGGNQATGNQSGSHSVDAGSDVSFLGGSALLTYAQFGNGNTDTSGNQSGNQSLTTGGTALFQGGSGDRAYAQLGNGGYRAIGDHNGGHVLTAGGDATFRAGNGPSAYAQLGNGGYDAAGGHDGGHSLIAGGSVIFQAGGSPRAYAQLGNGGHSAEGSDSGSHTITAGADVTFHSGLNLTAYAQFGNGGVGADGNHSGGHSLDAGGNVAFLAGEAGAAYALMGNGGYFIPGNQSGDHFLTAAGDVAFKGGGGAFAFAQFGNGGIGVSGNHNGSLSLTNAGNLDVTAGSGVDAYALLGHGSDVRITAGGVSPGTRTGDISVRVGETAVFTGSQVGHVTASGPLSITQANTLIGVSQNDPSYLGGTGQLLVSSAITTHFASAPTANGGELRFYIPRQTSQQIPTNATFNGSSFAITDTIPAAQLAGFALFGGGAYIPDYSFYLGLPPDVAVAKSAVPAGPLRPGQALTYTLSFSNTGTITATGVVLSDTLPTAVTFGSATSQLDAGVTITPTGSAPNLAWTVSDLTPGQGGKLLVTVNLQNSALLLGTTFTNTAIISATGDLTVTNNTAAVARAVIPAATLVITKSVVGVPPLSTWQFNASGGIAAFVLPAGGGSKVITGLIPATYAVTETAKSGYTSAVTCTTGQSGTNSVQVTLTPGVTTGCTFVNTEITQTLTVDKVVVGGPLNADDFTLIVDGTPVVRGTPKQLTAGQHIVSETSIPTYTASFGGACNAAGLVNLAAGAHVTCIVTNTYVPPVVITQTLAVNKVVVGGPLSADDFPLFIDGAPVGRGVATQLSAGQHTVSETGVSTYTAAFGEACDSSGVVNLTSGAHLTCTITNTYVPPVVITQTLTVEKVVVGGPLTADDFALFVDGAPVSRGLATALSVGAHTVTETGVLTYSARFGGACNPGGQVDLASGAHLTCTITNTYTPAVIALTKTVGTDPATCATTTELTVAPETQVAFCVTIQNTGQLTLTQHHLVDAALQIDVTLDETLGPGNTLTVLPADLPALAVTASEEITNTVTVTSSNGGVQATATAAAVVHMGPPEPPGPVYMPAFIRN